MIRAGYTVIDGGSGADPILRYRRRRLLRRRRPVEVDLPETKLAAIRRAASFVAANEVLLDAAVANDPDRLDPAAEAIEAELADLDAPTTTIGSWRWVGEMPEGPLTFQCSAHGRPEAGRFHGDQVIWDEPHRRIAPGQSVVAFAIDATTGVEYVAGGGIAGRTPL